MQTLTSLVIIYPKLELHLQSTYLGKCNLRLIILTSIRYLITVAFVKIWTASFYEKFVSIQPGIESDIN